jgi:hypothetical protein
MVSIVPLTLILSVLPFVSPHPFLFSLIYTISLLSIRYSLFLSCVLHPFRPFLNITLTLLNPYFSLLYCRPLHSFPFLPLTIHLLSQSPFFYPVSIRHKFCHSLLFVSSYCTALNGEGSGLHDCRLGGWDAEGGGGGGVGCLWGPPGDGPGCFSSVPSLVNEATLSLTKTAAKRCWVPP